jgi:hypothetical protein
MLELIFLGLLQAAAGDPAPAAEPTGPADQTQTQTQQQPAQIDPRDVVRCRTIRPPGARVGGERFCSTPREDEELRQATREMQNRLQTMSASPPPPPDMAP